MTRYDHTEEEISAHFRQDCCPVHIYHNIIFIFGSESAQLMIWNNLSKHNKYPEFTNLQTYTVLTASLKHNTFHL